MKRLFSIVAILLVGTSMTAFSMEEAEAKTPKALLLDLGGIFYTHSKADWAWKIGPRKLLGYLGTLDLKNLKKTNPVLNLINLIKMQSTIFDVLSRAEFDDKDENLKPACTTSGREFPYILTAYQAGRITDKVALEKALATLQRLKEEEYFACDRQAEVVEAAIRLMFSPEVHAELSIEIPQGIELLQDLKDAQLDDEGAKRYELIVLSNWDKHSGALVQERFEAFKLFDAIHLSGDMGTIKPNKEAFEYVLGKHEFEKEDYIFIDDQKENVDAAEECGIKSYLFTDYAKIRAELRELGIDLPQRPQKTSLKKKVGVAALVAGFGIIGYNLLGSALV